MPILTIVNDSEGQPQVKTTKELPSGPYHASALVIAEEAQAKAINVGIGSLEILKAKDNRIILTHSLASCFPAIFMFKNGDIGLYHGNTPFINIKENTGTVLGGKPLFDAIPASEIGEILIFEKGVALNTGKALTFAKNLQEHFKEKGPKILVQAAENVGPAYNYGVAAVYKSPEGKPIILIGESAKFDLMAKNKEECEHEEDSIKPYTLIEYDPKVRPIKLREEVQQPKKSEQAPTTDPTVQPQEEQQEMLQKKMKSIVQGMRDLDEKKFDKEDRDSPHQ
ncbi:MULTISPECIES: hypothetical protein [Legionella]|nr:MULTISPECIES: hypothetical protein [Legionella]MBN9228208.1 hypothetical protein [Legionella steelei]OJW11947.1 MAG: hypothetical protein BGO44_02645 [Legionella sp. 39-23]